MSLFHEGGGCPEKNTLSLMNNVTISLGGVGVKVNLDNVTKYDGFFFEGVPYRYPAHSHAGHLTCKYSTISAISACISLQVLQLEAPAHVKYGHPIVLKCDFDLAGKTLYRYRTYSIRS